MTDMGRGFRWPAAVLVAVIMVGAQFAYGQRIQCIPANACSTPIVFSPTPTTYLASIGGTLSPTSPSTPIHLRVHLDGTSALDLQTVRTLWSPDSQMGLEARFTVIDKGTPTRVIGWFPVTAMPNVQSITGLSGRGNIDIELEYRLVPAGNTPPGSYVATVSYEVAGGAAGQPGNGSTTITNMVSVDVPPFVALRFDGVSAGQVASEVFDYGSNGMGYVNAVISGRPLTFSSATFTSLDVATDNSTGFSVAIDVAAAKVPSGSSLTANRILLFGSQANGQTLGSPTPTSGFVPLVTPTDITVGVDGGELPGDYVFTITYTATPNP